MMLNALTMLFLTASAAAIDDAPFVQEYHEPYPLPSDAGADDVRAVAVDAHGTVFAAAKAGLYALSKGQGKWRALMSAEDAGPVFDVMADGSGAVWAGAWNGLYRAREDSAEKVDGIDGPVAALCAGANGILAISPDGIWRSEAGTWKREPYPFARSIRAALADPEGGFWVGTGNGLYHQTPAGVSLYQKPEDILSCDVQGIAYAPDGSLWAGGFGGITVFKNGEKSATIGTAEGLPSPYVQSIAQGPDGRMWIGTLLGVTRYDGTKWSLRHSRRWLLGDDVRGVAFGADGTAWVATAGGVSAIKRKTVTLAEKARYFHEVCMARHVRAPWIVEKCRLDTPGDLSTYKPEDDDNDGGYTAFYMVMEAMRYAVTKDAGAKENARKAFDLLELLQTITETDGFFARTIVPSTWTKMHDPGDDFDARELADSRVGDPRQKPVKERWHLSRDGQWFWKGDTSSDEVTAHMYGYLFYYDLVADDAEKARVRALVCRIMDHIVSNGFVLVDIDGKHTRWGVWAPERLNGDPDWAAEQGINSLEILSYLKTAYHVSGDAKYQEQYERLIEEHGYGEMARHAKTFAPAWRTHIDDELLCFAFPALLLYEKDSELKALYRESLDRWYEGVRNDCNPYFNFMYAALTGSDPNMDDSIAFLRDAPLDLVNWTVDNSTREDLKLERAPEVEPLQTHPLPPADERGVMRWDKNPWMAVSGDGGTSEWCPAYWLTPYWMGRYYGYIGAAE